MKILLVEDDPTLAELTRNGLKAVGHVIDLAADGGEGSFLGKSYDYDVIILDYSLPKKDGLAVCRELRTAGKVTPIIFCSVIDDVATKVAAFDAGADDYVVKPIALAELQARLRALHRRPALDGADEVVSWNDITMDMNMGTVRYKDREISLTRKEFGVLEYLIRHKDIVVSRMMIMEHVWSADTDSLANTVETHIRNIRKKVTAAGAPDFITTIPGRGYMISSRN